MSSALCGKGHGRAHLTKLRRPGMKATCANRGRPFRALARNQGDLTTASSRQGPRFPLWGKLGVSLLAATSFACQLDGVPSTHIRCRMTTSLRSTATFGFFSHWLGEPHAPGLQCPPFRHAGEENAGGFEQIAAQERVAAFRDPRCAADLAGGMTSASIRNRRRHFWIVQTARNDRWSP
jgi:hypothetical protein